MGKEEIVDLNSSGSVKAKLIFEGYYMKPSHLEPYWTYLLNKVSLFIDKPNNIAIDRDCWLKLVEKCGGKVKGGHIEWPEKIKRSKGEYIEVDMYVEAGIRLPKNSNELFRNCCFNMHKLYNFKTDDVLEMREMFKFYHSDHEPCKISGIENWNVSNVADFTSTFEGANIGELNLSNWKLHPWLSSHINKMADAFKGCRGLGCLALPKGFNTTISSRDNNNVDHIFADAEIPALRERYVMDFSNTAPTELPTFLRMADVLVQPGTPDAFDDYRFPSKLPLFLASARPVVLPRTNIGAYLTDGHNCRHLEVNTPEAIAGHVADLLEHPGTAAHIGQNGRAFAREHFSWRNTAQKLLDFYTLVKSE